MLKTLRFVDEHDWNIVLDAVLQAACVADEFLVLSVVLQIPFALRTSQDVQ